MRVFDVSDPADPKPVTGVINTAVATHTGGACVIVSKGLAYITGGQGLAIFDVKDPTNLTKISTLNPGNTGVLSVEDAGCVALSSDTPYAYVCGSGGLSCVDLTDPKKPATVGSTIFTGVLQHESPGYLQYDAVRKMLFVSGGMGLAVYDLYSPSSAEKACETVTTEVFTHYGGGFNCLSPSGKHVLASGGMGLAVFEIQTDGMLRQSTDAEKEKV
jgi:hypothetical protein